MDTPTMPPPKAPSPIEHVVGGGIMGGLSGGAVAGVPGGVVGSGMGAILALLKGYLDYGPGSDHHKSYNAYTNEYPARLVPKLDAEKRNQNKAAPSIEQQQILEQLKDLF